jgi:hypothetical protein
VEPFVAAVEFQYGCSINGQARAGQSMYGGLRLVAVSLQAGSVMLGYFWGAATHYPGRPPSVYTAGALAAVLLMIVGALGSLLFQPGSQGRSWGCFGVLAYCVAAMLFEPFLWAHQLGEVIVACVVLLPLLLAIGYLVRVRAWPSAVGVTLFVLTSSAMIASNASVSDAGSGFFGWWTS